jgi:hypothetical protein
LKSDFSNTYDQRQLSTIYPSTLVAKQKKKNADLQLDSAWTKRWNEVSLWFHHVDKKQLTTSEKNQSSPAIWCKTLF